MRVSLTRALAERGLYSRIPRSRPALSINRNCLDIHRVFC